MPQDVPEPFKEPLEVLGRFTDEQTKFALSSLESLPYIASRTSVRDALYLAFPDDKRMRPALRELGAMLMAFARVRHTQGTGSAKQMFDNFSAGPNLALTGEQRDVLPDRLLAFVELPGLVLAARAGHEERNHERLLTDSSVETDLRPLMDDDGKMVMVIPWHTLNLRFTSRQFDEDQSESITLDHADLISLREQIDAALEAKLRLQRDMETHNINVWEPYVPEKQDKKSREEAS